MATVLNYAAEASTILAFLVVMPGACATARKRIRERRTTWRPLALLRKRTAAAAEVRTLASSPHRLSAATRRACANRAILPARSLLKPSKITVKAVCDRRPTGDGQDGQVQLRINSWTARISPALLRRRAPLI